MIAGNRRAGRFAAGTGSARSVPVFTSSLPDPREDKAAPSWGINYWQQRRQSPNGRRKRAARVGGEGSLQHC